VRVPVQEFKLVVEELKRAMPVLVYDIKLRRPGCALLQAALGGDPGMANSFPSEHWLLAPTPDMKTYNISDEQLRQVIKYHRELATIAAIGMKP
jgi:hypothetical protein